MMKLDSFLQKLIVFLFSSLFFLVPLFFTPFNSELFEFNKMILVYAFSTLITGAWLGRIILQRRIFFTRTPLDIPLALFLLSQVLSTLFSVDQHTSVFGYYSRFNGGLLSTISYLLLYWTLVSNCHFDNVIKFLKISLISGLVISVYGILEHFGHSFSCLMFEGKFDVSCWVQRVQERVFATLGQPNWLAAYLAVLIPISLGLALNAIRNTPACKRLAMSGRQYAKLQLKTQNFYHLSFTITSLIFFVCLLFTGSRSGFLGLVIALLFFWFSLFFFSRRQLKEPTKLFLFFIFYFLFFIFLFGSPFPQINKFLYYQSLLIPTTRHTTQNPQPISDLTIPQLEVGGSESSQIRKIVWQGAVDIFKHYPFWGSGVETFAYSYYNFRPAEHNLVSEWDFLYNKAHNEYLNYLSTTGIFGLGSYCLFVIIFIFWSLRQIAISLSRYLDKEKKRDNDITSYRDNDLIIALFSAWLSILVSNFFGFSVVIVSLYFYLIPAFIFVLAEISSPPTPPSASWRTSNPSSFSQKLLLLTIFLFTFYILHFTFNMWQADRFYAKGQNLTKQNRLVEGYQNLASAVSLSPNEPVFLNELSMTTANLALLSLEAKDATTSNQLKDSAIAFSDKALAISPKNLNLYKTRTRVFYTLSTLDSRYLDEAIETLNQAIKLAPTDPKLIYNLGLLYGRKEKSQEAFAYFQKAIDMKPNYEEVRNAIALFYEDLGQKEKAIEQLEYILKTKPDDKNIKERIEKLKSQ